MLKLVNYLCFLNAVACDYHINEGDMFMFKQLYLIIRINTCSLPALYKCLACLVSWGI